MYGYYDSVALTATQFENKKGEVLDEIITFPIKEKLDLPNDITKMSIYEIHSGKENYSYEAFKICVGKVTNWHEICKKQSTNFLIDDKLFTKIKKIDEPLCYFEEGKNKYVFALLEEGDMVVESIEELKKALINISISYQSINNSLLDIKDNPKTLKLSKESK